MSESHEKVIILGCRGECRATKRIYNMFKAACRGNVGGMSGERR